MAMVTVTAFNKDNYSKVLARLSEEQIHSTCLLIKETNILDMNASKTWGSSVTIDPKDFPEMVRFVITVEQ